MTQIRLYLTAEKLEAERIFDLLEREFEDDGLALANMEIDEPRQIYEVSVYAHGDEDAVSDIEARMANRLGSDGFGLEIAREVLPDIDWVAKSLEGLKPVRAGRFLVHGRHDRDAVRANDIAVEIEAGQAFGTGHHVLALAACQVAHDAHGAHGWAAPATSTAVFCTVFWMGSGVLSMLSAVLYSNSACARRAAPRREPRRQHGRFQL